MFCWRSSFLKCFFLFFFYLECLFCFYCCGTSPTYEDDTENNQSCCFEKPLILLLQSCIWVSTRATCYQYLLLHGGYEWCMRCMCVYTTLNAKLKKKLQFLPSFGCKLIHLLIHTHTLPIPFSFIIFTMRFTILGWLSGLRVWMEYPTEAMKKKKENSVTHFSFHVGLLFCWLSYHQHYVGMCNSKGGKADRCTDRWTTVLHKILFVYDTIWYDTATIAIKQWKNF